jgi:hypothetical protein
MKTKTIVKCFGLMEGVIATSVNAKKPDEETNVKIQGLFKTAGSAVIDVEKKDKFRDHAKAIRQIINSSFWVFTVKYGLVRIHRKLLSKVLSRLPITMQIDSGSLKSLSITNGTTH